MILRTHVTHKAAKEATSKSADALDIAVRYFVYKLHVPGNATTKCWHPVSTLGEAAVTVGSSG